jgi:Dehydrogenase E1 component
MPVMSQDESRAGSALSVALSSNQQSSMISNEKLKQLYSAMVQVRFALTQSARSSSKAARFALQEACIVGCAIDLRAEDTAVTPTDQPLEVMWHAEPRSETRVNTGAPTNVLELESSPERIAWATGIALHARPVKGSVVVVFALPEEIGDARQSLRLAQERGLSILYVELELNSKPKTRRSKRGGSFQMPAIPVDKTDVAAIYRVASEAIDKARRGAGPTLIRCVSYAQRGARLADDAHSADPIRYMEHYLRKRDLWSDELRMRAMDSHQLTQAEAKISQSRPSRQREPAIDR